MADYKDYIPDSDAEFDEWEKNFRTHLGANYASWNIPYARMNNVVNTLGSQWDTDYARGGEHADPKSSETEAKNQTRKLYETEIRKIVKEYIVNSSLVNDEQRIEIGVTVRDTEPTSRAKITTAPITGIKNEPGARFLITCRVEEDSTRASRHPDADSIEMKYQVGGEAAPARPDDCSKTITFTKAIHTIELDIGDAGKRLYCYLRWKNTGDDSKSGPWTRQFSAIIAD